MIGLVQFNSICWKIDSIQFELLENGGWWWEIGFKMVENGRNQFHWIEIIGNLIQLHLNDWKMAEIGGKWKKIDGKLIELNWND